MKGSTWTRAVGIGAVAACGLTLSGCDAREFLESGRHDGTLFLGTFASFAIVGFLIAFFWRRSQLVEWDLSVAAAAPPALDSLHWLYWSAGIGLVLFAVADLTLVEHRSQAWLNLLLWAGGTVIGGFLGGFFGLRLAERRWR